MNIDFSWVKIVYGMNSFQTLETQDQTLGIVFFPSSSYSFKSTKNKLNPFSIKWTKGHTLPNNRNEVENTTKTTIRRDGWRWWWWRWNNNQKAKCYVEHTNTFKPVIVMWLRVFVWFSFSWSLFISVAIEYRLDHSVFFQLRSPWSWKWYTREGKKKKKDKNT